MVKRGEMGADIVTLLFTDLVGSTELCGRLGDDAAENVRRTHFQLLREAVSVRGGEEVKNLGDGLMVVFSSALAALSSAIAIQQAVQEHNERGHGPAFHVRVGLHAGEPIRDEHDYFGMAVIVAKRLCDAASGDQILASGLVTGLVGSRGAFQFRPVGPLELKGVPEAVPAAEVAWQPAADTDAGPSTRYRVLGPVEALDDRGVAISVPSARQRLLLALLLGSNGQVVSTDALVEALWGDDQPADPRGSLQSQVWRLRQRLGPEPPLETTPNGYRLSVGAQSDAELFEHLVAEARRTEGDPAAALDHWEAALALWRGPAFFDLADHPALAPRAAALEGLRAEAGEARAGALLAVGRASEALAAAEALSAESPFRERPVELRMRALAALGRVVEALRAYEAFRRHLADEVGLDPSPELRALEAEIVRHERSGAGNGGSQPSPVGRGAAGTVVRPPTMAAPIDAFVGRDAEIERLAELLQGARLVTVVGPGGVGKTRLSLQVIGLVAPRYPDGVWCCDLASVASDDRVADVVASTLRVDQRAGLTMVERVVEFLAATRALLLFDNCEHVIEGAAALTQAVLAGAADVDVLATSREPLGLPGEQRLPLDPLPVPAETEADAPAVVLFARRAAAANPTFSLDDANLAAVCELCRRVDGLPLAIELAAARVAARSVAEVNAEVSERLGDLGGGGRGRVARHRSTQAVVGWSYDLLPDPDRRFFERLAVFAGGWSAEAAAGICAEEGSGHVVDQLVRLVDQSLVVARPQGNSTRYALLEPIRAYAAGRLHDSGRHDETRARHTRFFINLAEQADAGMRSEDEPAWVARLERELANLRAAHHWLLESGDGDGALRLSAALFWYGFGSGASEVFAWAEQAAERFAGLDHPQLPTVYALGAVGAWQRGDLARSAVLAERGVEVAKDYPVTGRLAREAVGDVCGFSGEFEAAADHFLAAVDLARAVGDDFQAAWDTGSAALVLAYAGDLERSRPLAEEMMAGALTCGSPSLLALAHFVAGEVRLDTAPEEAAPLFERSLAEAAKVPNRFVLGIAGLSAISAEAHTADPLTALGRYPALIEHWSRSGAWNHQWVTIRKLIAALAGAGQHEAAAVLHGALCASATATPLAGSDATSLEAVVDRLRKALGEDDLATMRARGAALGDTRAVAYAITTLRELVGSSA